MVIRGFSTILRDLHNLSSVNAEWRKSEATSLSALVQKRIRYLQVRCYWTFSFPLCVKFVNLLSSNPERYLGQLLCTKKGNPD